jgi:hypothetical protein
MSGKLVNGLYINRECYLEDKDYLEDKECELEDMKTTGTEKINLDIQMVMKYLQIGK